MQQLKPGINSCNKLLTNTHKYMPMAKAMRSTNGLYRTGCCNYRVYCCSMPLTAKDLKLSVVFTYVVLLAGQLITSEQQSSFELALLRYVCKWHYLRYSRAPAAYLHAFSVLQSELHWTLLIYVLCLLALVPELVISFLAPACKDKDHKKYSWLSKIRLGWSRCIHSSTMAVYRTNYAIYTSGILRGW